MLYGMITKTGRILRKGDVRVSTFSIRPGAVRGHAVHFQNAANSLRSSRTQVLDLISEMDYSDKAYSFVKESLKTISEQIEQEAVDADRLFQALLDVVKEYEKTEQEILQGIKGPQSQGGTSGKTGGKEETIEPDYTYAQEVQALLDKLRGKDISIDEYFALLSDLLIRASFLDPDKCSLTKAEKEALLRWLGPALDVAGMIGNKTVKLSELLFGIPAVESRVDSPFFNQVMEAGVIELLAQTPILGLLGFQYNPATDSYYTTEGCIQQQWGFCDAIDRWGPALGMDLDTDIVTFTYDGQEFRSQLWKGIYGGGLSVGSELGLYSRPQGEALATPYVPGDPNSDYILYDAVDQKYQPSIIQVTEYYDPGTNRWRSFENDTASYGDGDDYWSLNIRTDANADKSSIRVSYMVDCSKQGPEFADAYLKALKKSGNLRSEPVMVDDCVIRIEY